MTGHHVFNMDKKLWTDVDQLLEESLIRTSNDDRRLINQTKDSGLPEINVTPLHGSLLTILVKSINASSCLEIGTLGGFSSSCIARGMDRKGKIISLEVNEKHKTVAERNLAERGLSDQVEIKLGPAIDSLKDMIKAKTYLFDFVFIDADKMNNKNYVELVLKMCHKGSLIYVDNVVQSGSILKPSADNDSAGNAEMIEYIKGNSELMSTCIQTVGEKGYDGFLLAYVL